MNLVLKSCKSDSNAMTLVVEETETGRTASTTVLARVCGTPFLGQDSNVASLVTGLLASINEGLFWKTPDVVEEPAPRPSKAPKDAA